jgi:hypothetical protein
MKKGLTPHQREIIDREFPDANIEYDRKTIEKYSRNVRNIRLASGRYQTPAEIEERRKRAFSVKLY